MHSSPRTLTRLCQLALVGVLGARDLSAQVVTDTERAFRQVQVAMETTDYRTTQVRRVRGQFSGYGLRGEWVGAIEHLVHRGQCGETAEAFALDLLGFEGLSTSKADLARRQVHYRSQGAYLFTYQSFRIHDARLAAHAYALHSFGGGCMRAGRWCNRVAVVSLTLDRPSWLLDLDAATCVPLYCGEFAADGSLVGELEVMHVAYGAAAQVPAGETWSWAATNPVRRFTTTSAACAVANQVTAVSISSTDVGAGYVFDHARVITNSITGQQSLVQVFQDGIDALFVTQRSQTPLQQPGHTARYYSDAGVSQCHFQQNRTEFLIVGRKDNLRDIARRIHRIAVATL